MMVSLKVSPVYPTVQSPTTPGQQSYPVGITDWSRASFIPSPRWQGPSSYAPLLLHQGVVTDPESNAYIGQLGSVSSSETQHQTMENSQIYGSLCQGESGNAESQGTFSSLSLDSVPVWFDALRREYAFPERPVCQFYQRNGVCKLGSSCKFDHPMGIFAKNSSSSFNSGCVPLGFDALQRKNVFTQRPGEPECEYYLRTGTCKLGISCEFDHPRERPIRAADNTSRPIRGVGRGRGRKFEHPLDIGAFNFSSSSSADARPTYVEVIIRNCGRVDRCLLGMITLTQIYEDTSHLLFTIFRG